MGFEQALSGLNAASQDLSVIGNNVANVGTVGFKAGQAQFADVFATSLSGGGSSGAGLGVKTAGVVQQFTQGNLSTTSNPLDMAINGSGFFIVSKPGSSTPQYSRNGQFSEDSNNYLVNSLGLRVQGYLANSSGTIVSSGTPGDLQIPGTTISPISTGSSVSATGVKANVNLNASDAVIPTTTAFNYNDPATYNESTALTVYDSLGAAHTYTMYFKKIDVNTWQVYNTVSNPAGAVPTITDLSNASSTSVINTVGSANTASAASIALNNFATNVADNPLAPTVAQVGLSQTAYTTAATDAVAAALAATAPTNDTLAQASITAANNSVTAATAAVTAGTSADTVTAAVLTAATQAQTDAVAAEAAVAAAIATPSTAATAAAATALATASLSAAAAQKAALTAVQTAAAYASANAAAAAAVTASGLSGATVASVIAAASSAATSVSTVNTPSQTLTFSTAGTLTSSPGSQTITAAELGFPAGVSNLTFPVNFTGSTQFGTAFSVNSLAQDGYASGQLSGFSVGSNGIIQGSYTNGQSKNIGQVVMANFANPQGLQPQGNNVWSATATSGVPLVNVPGAGGNGVLQSSATEDSNVDLTSQLVNMITAQRAYQANAQTIKTQDSIMQTLMNL
ncbi:flagellar hook protein FlgE [mine drainage metagenome]|uniref:Flagellar hook protein FlgE n=1 Tax=mine drainage metagenome TaxID=410659 RepID=A0A1J5QBJ5_9ZZZZ